MKLTSPIAFLLLSVFFIQSTPAAAQVNPEWVRYPAISPDGSTIAFTYKGDLYKVSSQGGQATRLTFHKAHDYKAVWSHDGKYIAFASDRHGNFDVYKMDALGGSATRLTFHSGNEEPYTFTKDDSAILFKAQRMDLVTHRQHPTGSQAELYSVPVTGGMVDQVFTVPAEDVQISADGSQLVYHDNKGFENPWRKHHRSAIARDLWTYDFDSGKHKKLTKFAGEDRNPVYSQDGKNIYYLSERSGSFNVHSLKLSRPSSDKQLTEFNTHPVRFLSRGGDTLAFSYHGHLYTMINGQAPQKVAISIRTQDIDNNIAMESVNGDISEMAVSPDGKEIAFIAHGEVFVSAQDGSFTKQITNTPSQEAYVSFSPEGDYLLYAAERDNKWSIFKASKVREQEPFFYAATLIQESAYVSNDKDNYLPKISPDGKKLAFIEDRRTLKVMDIDGTNSVELIPAKDTIHMRDGDQTFSWSPDSQWLLFNYDKLLNNSDVALVKADGSEKMKIIVPSGYYDSEPKWANDGKQIIWFSNRQGLKSYATSGRSQYDVYTLFFNQEDWDEYRLDEDEFALMQAIEEANEDESDAKKEDDDEGSDGDSTSEDGKDDGKDEDEAVEALSIEWDGLDERIARLTIHSSNLRDAVLNKEADTLYYLSRFEDDFDLWTTDLRTKETKKAISLGSRGGSLMWDTDMENLYLLSGGRINKLDIDGGKQKSVSINEKVEIDMTALQLHSFDHVWLRTSKIFYEPTFHGIDWVRMREEYRPKVAHVSNGYEFTELLSEMLGELNVSHAGARFRVQADIADSTASLGVFYDYNFSDGIKITEVINGGPLDKAKFSVEAGMIITSIDGVAINANLDWAKLLNRKAGKFTLLGIKNPVSGEIKQITMQPISLREQSALLYERYVKINEDEVLKLSKGQLGYVHIPGMGDGPYRSIYNDMMGRFYDKKAMVVDTRFNGGGDLVADLATFFTGEAFLTYAIEGKVVGGEPTSRYTKPVITLFNESMYSDGHCYASGFTDLKLGKSVGMPVPGTCSFAGWERLPMGGSWGVVPVSAKNKAGEWLENNQTEPDILIRNEPGVIDFGTDQQLERAVKELLKEVR
ncbi:S41 family peptidase [Glaciecola petra]|uniref:Tricorn protease homolog n=1 Tax=Glaciecola petra TaxID=3075602 RepID=A0ABU2ZQ79_9ALTE|nr:S41 family peptidase [Aestuariibacter sp. P117]MDT0594576.1 S41 family peptidase [Aestuariibacter sp. P117]